MYDLKTGEMIEYEDGMGGKLPILRDGPPPCSSCPKGSIDIEQRRRLSKRNLDALKMYSEIKSVCGSQQVPSHLQNCTVFAENMAIIDRVYRTVESEAIKESQQDGG